MQSTVFFFWIYYLGGYFIEDLKHKGLAYISI